MRVHYIIILIWLRDRDSDRDRDMVEEGLTLEYTPTWVVASLCTVIVAISLVAERLLHYTGKVCQSLSCIHISFSTFLV